MPVFSYKAKSRTGEPVTGTMEASAVEVVQEAMRESDLILLSVKEVDERTVFQRLQSIGGSGVKHKDLVIFSRQLAVLISATVPIVRALRILSKQTTAKHLKEIIGHIADDVDGGSRLSVAMHRYPRVFDDFFVYMIRAGETTGRLDEVLNYLADQKEKDYELVSRIISSLIYPAFIVSVLCIIFVFMMIYVVPRLLDIVTSSGGELPFVTRILLFVSNGLQGYWWLLLFVGFGLFFGYVALRRRPSGRQIIDAIKLRIPLVGSIFRKIYLVRITQSLSSLLSAGVPVNRSLEIVSDIVGSAIFRRALQQAQYDVEAGQTLSGSFAKNGKIIPPMMTQMMSVGEETGRLDQILIKIGDFYMSEVNSRTQALVSLVEPLIIIILGLGALILVSGILMPIYSVTAQL